MRIHSLRNDNECDSLCDNIQTYLFIIVIVIIHRKKNGMVLLNRIAFEMYAQFQGITLGQYKLRRS